MTIQKLFNLAKVSSSTTGTGDITLGSAKAGFLSFADAGVSDGDVVSYGIKDGSSFEVGRGTYSSTGPKLVRTTVLKSSNGNSAIDLSGSDVEVFISPLAEDFDVTGNLAGAFWLSSDVAAATTCDIGAATTPVVRIAGTTTITSLGTKTNRVRRVRFNGALTLTHNDTTLVLPGSANIITAAGDEADFASDSSGNWRCTKYQRASGLPLGLDTDGTLAANSDSKVPSQKAVKAYVGSLSSSVTTALAAKAPLASPDFTGTPTIGGANVLKAGDIDGLTPAADRSTLAGLNGATVSTSYLLEAGREGIFNWSASDLSASVTADPQQAFYVPPTGDATGASGCWVRAVQSPALISWFGAVGDGTTDDLVAMQAAADSHIPVYLDAKIYCTSDEIAYSDGTKLRGAGPFYKPRPAYAVDEGSHTTIKYIGEGGTNSCVVRISQMTVGTAGDDFVAPGTSDLVNAECRNIHVDGNNLAEIGFYLYRCGYNNSSFDGLTAEGTKKRGFLGIGLFGFKFGFFGAYDNYGVGIQLGNDYFGWGSNAWECFAIQGKVQALSNGQANTFVEDDASHDQDGAGVILYVGRGSEIDILTLENNIGRSAVLGTGLSGGPVDYIHRYSEGNGAGMLVDYRPQSTYMVIRDGFVQPDASGDGGLDPDNIKIVSRTNAGVVTSDTAPVNEEEWLVLRRLTGIYGTDRVSFDINSNTTKFFIDNIPEEVTFSSSYPRQRGVIAMADWAAISGLSVITAKNCTISRQSAGVYRMTFGRRIGTTDYHVSVSVRGASCFPRVSSQGATFLEITLSTTADPTTAADIGSSVRLLVSVSI